jgi:hypothetical protein
MFSKNSIPIGSQSTNQKTRTDKQTNKQTVNFGIETLTTVKEIKGQGTM